MEECINGSVKVVTLSPLLALLLTLPPVEACPVVAPMLPVPALDGSCRTTRTPPSAMSPRTAHRIRTLSLSTPGLIKPI